MRLRRRDVVLGLAVLLALIVGPAALLLRWAKHDEGLVVELPGEPSLVADSPLAGRVQPATRVSLSLDGQPGVVSDEGSFQLDSNGLGPGLHVAELRRASTASTEKGTPIWDRTVVVGRERGPFERPGAWRSCAVWLTLGQAFLDDFVKPMLENLLPERLADFPELPRVVQARAAARWAGDGIDVGARLDLANGRDLEIGLHVRLWVDDEHRLRLSRVGAVGAAGTQLPEFRMAALRVAAREHPFGLPFELLVDPRGVSSQIDSRIEQDLQQVADQFVAASVEEDLHAPPPVQLGNGIAAHLRYCTALRVEPNSGALLGFDVQTRVATRALLSKQGPSVRRLSSEPPLPSGVLPALVLDVSPALLDDVVNAFWRSGRLTAFMNERQWLDVINAGRYGDQLDVRVQNVEPLLPPSLEMDAGQAVVRVAETKLTLVSKTDGHVRDDRLFATVGASLRYLDSQQAFALDLQPLDLASTCHDRYTETAQVLLRPCYAELIRLVKDDEFPVLNPSLKDALTLPLRDFLFKKDGTPRLPLKLSGITPTILDSGGQPWVRVAASASP
ncbi:MAG: hypothetical protein ACYDCL_07085 [Myxococcales bacterium]